MLLAQSHSDGGGANPIPLIVALVSREKADAVPPFPLHRKSGWARLWFGKQEY